MSIGTARLDAAGNMPVHAHYIQSHFYSGVTRKLGGEKGTEVICQGMVI